MAKKYQCLDSELGVNPWRWVITYAPLAGIWGPPGLAGWGGLYFWAVSFFRWKQDGKNKLANCFPSLSALVWFVLSSAFPLTLNCCMPCILFAPAALGCIVRWPCPGPYSWDLRKPKKKKKGQLEPSEGWANTSCFQVWLGNRNLLMRGGDSNPAPHVSQQEDAFPCPTGRPCSWNPI